MTQFLCMMSMIFVWNYSAPALATRPTALLVVSGEGAKGGGKGIEGKPGYEMDELSQAWLVLTENGYDVHIASPKGGGVVADDFNAKKPYNAAFLSNPTASARVASTLRLEKGMGANHEIVMVIGGKGAMFDLPASKILQQVLLAQYQRGAVVAAVCHGPAVLANVRDSNGKPIIAGKLLSGFTNEEEDAFSKKWVKRYPFLIESRFRELGAQFGEAPIMLPYVAVDRNLVTAQIPIRSPPRRKPLFARRAVRRNCAPHGPTSGRWISSQRPIPVTGNPCSTPPPAIPLPSTFP